MKAFAKEHAVSVHQYRTLDIYILLPMLYQILRDSQLYQKNLIYNAHGPDFLSIYTEQ